MLAHIRMTGYWCNPNYEAGVWQKRHLRELSDVWLLVGMAIEVVLRLWQGLTAYLKVTSHYQHASTLCVNIEK